MTITTGEPNFINEKGREIINNTTMWGEVVYLRGDAETYSTNTLDQHVTVTEAQQS